jgi:hypothetical protein
VFAEAADPLGVRVTTEEELGQAFAATAQAQYEGRCALIEVILDPGGRDAGVWQIPLPAGQAADEQLSLLPRSRGRWEAVGYVSSCPSMTGQELTDYRRPC